MTPMAIEKAARTLLEDQEKFRFAMEKMRSANEIHGGRHKAAKLIHHEVFYGSSHLINAESHFTFVERNNLDILAIGLGILYLLVKVVSFLWKSVTTK